LEKDKLLGEGREGQVWPMPDNPDLAVKISEEIPNKQLDHLKLIMDKLEGTSHRNIVQIFDIDTESDAKCCIVMERIHKKKKEDGPDEEDLLKIFLDVARALDHLHKNKMIHCDVLRRNVIIAEDRAVLIDFGLAQVVEGIPFPAPIPNQSYPCQLTLLFKRGEPLSAKTDIFLFGFMMLQYLSKLLGEKISKKFFEDLKKSANSRGEWDSVISSLDQFSQWDRLSQTFSKPVVDIIKKCFGWWPWDRLSAAQLVERFEKILEKVREEKSNNERREEEERGNGEKLWTRVKDESSKYEEYEEVADGAFSSGEDDSKL
jgi:serine/threonine protein kinase